WFLGCHGAPPLERDRWLKIEFENGSRSRDANRRAELSGHRRSYGRERAGRIADVVGKPDEKRRGPGDRGPVALLVLLRVHVADGAARNGYARKPDDRGLVYCKCRRQAELSRDTMDVDRSPRRQSLQGFSREADSFALEDRRDELAHFDLTGVTAPLA